MALAEVSDKYQEMQFQNQKAAAFYRRCLKSYAQAIRNLGRFPTSAEVKRKKRAEQGLNQAIKLCRLLEEGQSPGDIKKKLGAGSLKWLYSGAMPSGLAFTSNSYRQKKVANSLKLPPNSCEDTAFVLGAIMAGSRGAEGQRMCFSSPKHETLAVLKAKLQNIFQHEFTVHQEGTLHKIYLKSADAKEKISEISAGFSRAPWAALLTTGEQKAFLQGFFAFRDFRQVIDASITKTTFTKYGSSKLLEDVALLLGRFEIYAGVSSSPQFSELRISSQSDMQALLNKGIVIESELKDFLSVAVKHKRAYERAGISEYNIFLQIEAENSALAEKPCDFYVAEEIRRRLPDAHCSKHAVAKWRAGEKPYQVVRAESCLQQERQLCNDSVLLGIKDALHMRLRTKGIEVSPLEVFKCLIEFYGSVHTFDRIFETDLEKNRESKEIIRRGFLPGSAYDAIANGFL